MSELQNPIFDEEKEFLERKKLEYERALRGDVEHIKEETQRVGKLALVGAGLAGGIWLITKAFSSKKRKHKHHDSYDDGHESDYDGFSTDYDTDSYGQYDDGEGSYDDDEEYYEDGPKSAAASAEVFMDDYGHDHQGHDQSYGGASGAYASESDSSDEPAMASYHTADARNYEDDGYDEGEEDDPFQDLPYDDSRRLPTSHAFDDDYSRAGGSRRSGSRSSMIGSVLQSFLQSDTGKVLVGQVAAVTLALVTKKVSEFFPTPKNSDLAASPGPAAADAGYSPVASSAPSVSSDASTQSQSL